MLDKLYIGLIFAVGILAAVFFTQTKIQEHKILNLRIERDNLKSAVLAKSLELENSKLATKTVENLLIEEKKSSIRIEEELRILKNEPEEENGSVSGLLRRGIDRLHDD